MEFAPIENELKQLNKLSTKLDNINAQIFNLKLNSESQTSLIEIANLHNDKILIYEQINKLSKTINFKTTI